MKYIEVDLSGTSKQELDTEIKFICASAKADSVELLAMFAEHNTTGDCDNKILSYAKAILNGMKRNGKIQFFVTKDRYTSANTEYQFLLNKCPKLISVERQPLVYVKL